MNILLVEDEPILLRMLQRFLMGIGYKVDTGTNGKEGLDKFSLNPNGFDIIISDVKTPIMDGVDFLIKVRENNQSIPFILMTGHIDSNYL